jgi:hypothetical protein
LRVSLHGEGNDVSLEEEARLMGPWLTEFHSFLEDKNITAGCLYNADQTGLYYQKLPNTLYIIHIEEKKLIRDCKQMKDKNRLTVMVCTSANGDKVPLAVVGKSKKPVSFDNQPPPLPYTNQANAWFDKGITRWWIQQVLLPYHNRYKGRGVPCCILLDNCSAHKLGDNEMEELERKNVFIKFLPPNLTSKRQPADMGMIASLKAGYKTFMLNELLDLFDQEGGFELAAERRQKQKKDARV